MPQRKSNVREEKQIHKQNVNHLILLFLCVKLRVLAVKKI